MKAQLLKVLLVEDDFKEAARFEKLLSKNRRIRFALTRTQRLDETLRLLEQDSFDVIVLDLSLPDSQGLETVANVRSKALLTPILVLTDREDEQLAAKAIGSGAQDYLIKGQVNSPLLAYALRYAIEHTQMLQQLRESKERYALALEGSQVGVWDWNLTTNEIYLDPSLKAILGYADKEIQNHVDDWFTLVHPDDRQALTAAVNAHLEGLAPQLEIEHRMVHKNGSIRWMLDRGTAIRDATGKPYRVTGTDTDITSRKQAQIALDIQREQVEQALERERQQLREIIANAPVAIAMFDTQMRCLVHSHKWAIDYGLEGQSIIGRTLCQIFSDIPNHWGAIAQRALNGEVLSQPEDKWEREDGSTLYLRWAVQPWSTPEGSVGGVVIATDRINELVEAREAALENSRLKSQFLANMSHEIRTPMNGVLGMTELLGKTDLNPEQLDFVQTLRMSAENLLTLLNDILDFSKLEANEMRLKMQEFDLNRCVEDVADLFFTVAQSKRIELAVLKVVYSLATFWGMQVEEASNCAEAVTVWRSVESKNQFIDVAIFDLNLLERESDSVRAALALVIQANNWSEGLESLSHNAGTIPSGQADLAVSSDSKQLKRTTKWLLMNSVQERSLALRLMDLGFSGCITKPIKASKLLGCLRQVLTPLDGHQERDRATQRDSVIAKPKSAAYRSKLKILLVEDIPTNQKVVLNQLKELGYEADCVVNGQEALNLLTRRTDLTGTGDWEHWEEGESGRGGERGSGLYHRRGSGRDGLDAFKKGSTRRIWYHSLTPTVSPYDIVLMDCQMPVMDGYEATRLLRVFEGESRRTVVIAMTASALVGDREKCMAANMDDYISKPVTLDALEEVLERWIPQRLRDSHNQTAENREPQTKSLSATNSQNLERLTPDANSLSTRLKLSSLGDRRLNEVPVDLQRLSELSGGDSEFQRELLEVFLEDAVVYVEELKSALASRDCVTLARRAHQLKGTSATVAIYKMPEIAAQLEHQAEENQFLGASDLLTQLEQILKDVQAFIEER